MSGLASPGKNGLVFNIQGFSIQDGPGIRTVVFLKGCPLRCDWCSNPESQTVSRDILHIRTKCVKCYMCINKCPLGAISVPEKDEFIKINHQSCADCQDHPCIKGCYQSALEDVGSYMTIEDVMGKVVADEAFYQNSGGGVTLSGGEALMQSEFCTELFKECRKNYIHTAIETCGYAPWEKFKELLDYTDLVLYDVKHMDSDIHKELTGVSNELILRNLEAIFTQTKVPTIIRVPVIPGANDSNENLEATARFTKKIGAKEVNIMAYHRLGTGKYAGLGREYPFGMDVITPSEARMKEVKGIFEAHGLTCAIV